MKIIHIVDSQSLPIGAKPTPEQFESIVQSEFNIAHEIRKCDRGPVLLETRYQDISNPRHYIEFRATQSVFPSGLFPDNFCDLTDLQKECLYDEGAARVLFALYYRRKIYKSIHQDVFDSIKGKDHDKYDLLDLRESEAMKCAKEAIADYYFPMLKVFPDRARTVILVFGSDYNFLPHCNRRGFEHQRIDVTVPLAPTPTVTEKVEIDEKGKDCDRIFVTTSKASMFAKNVVGSDNSQPAPTMDVGMRKSLS